MNRLILTTPPFVLALLTACGPVDPTAAELESTDSNLAAVALALAPALEDPNVQVALSEALNERRTGDYEVMLSDLGEIALEDGRTIGGLLSGLPTLDSAAIHLATPGGVPDFSSGSPRITWIPVGHEPEELELFDTSGGRSVVSAEVAPAGPLVVVGMNERMGAPDSEGLVGESASGLRDCPAGSCRRVRLDKIQIFTKSEPWYKGDPEIYMACFDVGVTNLNGYVVLYAELDLPDVDHLNTWYTINRRLLEGLDAGHALQCWVLERDGGRGHPIDADDVLGSARVGFEDPSPKPYYTSYAQFRLSTEVSRTNWGSWNTGW